jgi:hypothetical protein
VTDLVDLQADQPDDDAASGDSVGPPIVPIVLLVLTTVASVVFLGAAIVDEAGSTDEVSRPALFAWLFGSLLGLLLFAWFGLRDSVRRSTGEYVEAAWRPRVVAAVLATVGWLAGSAGAFLVAEAVARR